MKVLRFVLLVLCAASLSNAPLWAQRGGGGGGGAGGGGAGCASGGSANMSSSNYAANSPYMQNPLASQYALQQMQQQYMQQMMAMRQQYAMLEMQNRQLQAQLRGQLANQSSTQPFANSKVVPKVNAQGDSNELLVARPMTDSSKTAATRKKDRTTRAVAQPISAAQAKQLATKD